MTGSQPVYRTGKSLLAIALIGAVYLTIMVFSREGIAGCSGTAGCATLLESRWSHAFGIPVSFLGMLVYAMCIHLAREYVTGKANSDFSVLLKQICGGLVILAAVWFTALQALVLKRFCWLCTVVHLSALAGVICLYLCRRSAKSQLMDCADPTAPILPRLAEKGRFSTNLQLATALTLGAAVFILGPAVGGIPKAKIILSDHELLAGEIAANRTISLHGGKFTFRTEDLPVLGDSTASSFAVALMDYSCEHCRAMHAVLEKTLAQTPSPLAIYLLPASRDVDGQDVQATMQILLRTHPHVFRELSADMLAERLLPVSTEVRDAAIKRIGEATFQAIYQQHGVWARYMVEATRGVHVANKSLTETLRLPQLMVGSKVLVGYYEQPERVLSFLVDSKAAILPTVPTPTQTPGAPLATAASSSTSAPFMTTSAIELKGASAGAHIHCNAVLSNPLAAALEIDWLEMDTGCTLTETLQKSVPPNSQIELPLEIQAPQTTGKFTRQVIVHYQHAGQSMQLPIFIHGAVQAQAKGNMATAAP